jgi:hypothetical protein
VPQVVNYKYTLVCLVVVTIAILGASCHDDRTNYQELLIEVRERIRSAQYAALKAVNHELIALYWLIVDRQQTAGWVKSIFVRRLILLYL